MIWSKGFLKWLKYTQIENGSFFFGILPPASDVVFELIARKDLETSLENREND